MAAGQSAARRESSNEFDEDEAKKESDEKARHKSVYVQVLKELLGGFSMKKIWKKVRRKKQTEFPHLKIKQEDKKKDIPKEKVENKSCTTSISIRGDVRASDANESEDVGLQSAQKQTELQKRVEFVWKSSDFVSEITLQGGRTEKSNQKIQCKDILVSGFSACTTEDDILIYFQSKKSSGGDAEIMIFDEKQSRVVVSFEEVEAFERVLNRDHTLNDMKLSVEKYPKKKMNFQLKTTAVNAIHESLPLLSEKLRSHKALCKIDEAMPEIVVVCLETEHEEVSMIIKDFLKKFEEEMIRKTNKTATVNNIGGDYILFLEKFELFEDIKTKYPEVHVNADIKQRQVNFEGPNEQLDGALQKYRTVLDAITSYSFDVDHEKPLSWDAISERLCEYYFPSKFAAQNIKAKIFNDKANNSYKLVAASSVEHEKAKLLLQESIIEDQVQFTKENANVVESEKCKKLLLRLKHCQSLEIHVEMSTCLVKLFGVREIVPIVKKEIEDFIQVEQIQRGSLDVSEDEASLLTGHLFHKVKDIEESLKNHSVSIQVDQAMGKVQMTGTQEGLTKCKEGFAELFAQIVKKTHEFSYPGLQKLVSEENVKENFKMIEKEEKVIITFRRLERQPRTKPPAVLPKPKTRLTTQQFKHLPKELLYNLCNFTTDEKIKVSWKYGSIENETADVLVSSAHSNLNIPTAVGKALNKRGGASFVKACKVHTNIPPGDIAYTGGGDLPSKFVIHAVCCHWDTQGAEKLFRTLVRKILEKCLELRVSSVALPPIGTGQHGFPEKTVFTIIREEVKSLSKANPLQVYLKDVRVIVFDAKQTTTPTVAGSRTLCIGSVGLLLNEGDITQREADAIVNVLPIDLKLSSGGGVCRRILSAGGQKIQQELEGLGKRLPGSVFVTNAGSMTNVKKILHVVPTSTDVQGLQTSVEKCLNEAKRLSLHSVSIAAIGTASLNLSLENSADLIINAAKNFSTTNYALLIKIVIFQKDLVPGFEKAIQERVKESATTVESQLQRTWSSSSQSPQAPSTSNQQTIVTIGGLVSVVVFHFTAGSQRSIDESVKKVKKIIERNTARREIKYEKVCEVLQERKPEVKILAQKYDVLISCLSPGVACIEGTMQDVFDCKDELFDKYLFSDKIRLPEHWDQQPPEEPVKLISLSETSPEYKQVLKHFTSTGGTYDKIKQIERVQNPGLYKAYLAKKQSMNGKENEKQLFHGTRREKTLFINANNFNRSYSGINGDKYGNGVYFARDASYSLAYSRQGNAPPFTMYVAKVLIGQYTAGSKGMKAPPSRNDLRNPGLLYDSVVDNVEDPNIFVIFVDHQCYPEYLITFN